MISQGDILRIEGIQVPCLVVSRELFNTSEMLMICPIIDEGTESALHIPLPGVQLTGFVWVEQLRSVDISARGYSRIKHLDYRDCIQIMDVVKNIFEYV